MMIKKFIGDKQFIKTVLVIAVPLMLQNLVSAGVNLVDNMMVGQLGDAALSGVVAVNRVYMVAFFGIMGLMASASIFIAQYYGAKDEDHMRQAFRFGLVLSVGIGIGFALMGLIFPREMVSFFTKDEAILVEGVKYFHYAALSLIPLGGCVAIGGAMRSIGDVKTPMTASIVAVFTNMFFNYMLIFGHFGAPKMGVAGAALATLIARIVELIILIAVMKYKSYGFGTKLSQLFVIQPLVAQRIFIKAIPLTVNEILWASGMATLFKFYATRGTEVMSGYAIAMTVGDLFFTLFGGMAAATTIILSQQLGANKLESAKADAYKLLGLSVCLAAIFGVLLFGTSFVIPQFYNVSALSKATAVNFLRIVSVMFWVYMGSAQCYFILRSGGDTTSTFIMDSLYMWVVNIPIVGMVAYLTKVNIVVLYMVGQSTDFIKLILSYRLVRKGNWIKNLTIHPNKNELDNLV
jgi:putative MATE family efflux protein